MSENNNNNSAVINVNGNSKLSVKIVSESKNKLHGRALSREVIVYAAGKGQTKHLKLDKAKLPSSVYTDADGTSYAF